MTEHLPECCFEPHVCDVNFCQRCHAFCICNQLRACEERVIAAAVQRIEALPWTSETWTAHAERAATIAAIKGDQP